MKKRKFTAILLFTMLLSTGLAAQTVGTVSGKVIDSENGEAISFATVAIRAAKKFAQTDLDGRYTLSDIPVGKHKIEFILIGRPAVSKTVIVKSGKTSNVNITWGIKIETRLATTVTARRISNTAASLITRQKKAIAVQDAISYEQIKKTPDNNVADAAKRVTGVSILGGKYLYIRGLGERYSIVQVNGAMVPSPIPTRRVVPLDLFPVNLIDNLTIVKTYEPSLYGAFAGGVVQLNTKDYPDKAEIKTYVGIGSNDRTTLKSFSTYNGGKLDFLGYDDGTRNIPGTIKSQKLVSQNISWNNTYNHRSISAIPAGKAQFSFGNTYKINETQNLGVVFSTFYRESSQNINGYFSRVDADKTPSRRFTYNQSEFRTSNSSQIALAYKLSKAHKLKATSFYTHSSSDVVRKSTGLNSSDIESIDVAMRYVETDVIFNQFGGSHVFGAKGETRLDWFVAASRAMRNQPDTKKMQYEITGILDPDGVTRYFNSHGENLFEGGPKLTLGFKQWQGLKSKLVLGLNSSLRDRISKSRRFSSNDISRFDRTQNYETLASRGQLTFTEDTGAGAGLNPAAADSYRGTLLINAGYSYIDMPVVPGLRAVIGARVEYWQQVMKGFDEFDKSVNLENSLKNIDVMPSLNLICAIDKDINLRLSGSRTINRPDFIEASSNRIFDDVEAGSFISGNPNLKTASILNGDLRLEWFPEVGDVIALTAFTKFIENPIERTLNASGGSINFSYANQKQAKIFGSEFEIRKNLGFITQSLQYFSALGNVTYTFSKITLNPDLKLSETDVNRPLQGQSPFILNLGLFFDQEKWGTSASVLYNIFGRRIVEVGVNGIDNTFEESYPKLDAVITQSINDWSKLKLAVANILDPEIERYIGEGAGRILAGRYKRGVNISLSYKVQI